MRPLWGQVEALESSPAFRNALTFLACSLFGQTEPQALNVLQQQGNLKTTVNVLQFCSSVRTVTRHETEGGIRKEISRRVT